MAKYFTAKNLSLLYNVVGMLPFGVMSADMVTTVWPEVQRESCTKGSWGSKDACGDSLHFTVGKIYLQVMFGMSLLYSCQLIFSHNQANLASMACLTLTMAKHIVVDGLIPPPPVMVLTALTIGAQFAPGAWGKRAFVFNCFFNALTFLTQPLMVLQDSFPEVVEGSKEAELGAFSFEVISLYLVMAGLVALVPIRSYGLALASHVGLAVIAKHVLVNKSGPPPPMIGLWILTTLVAWYESGWKMDSRAEKAIKAVPQYVHGLLMATNFLPLFILEAMGLSPPVLGFAALDSSYSYGGLLAMLFGMLAVFTGVVAWIEATGQMEGRMFAAYHYALSIPIFLWQCARTTSVFGACFFMMPHAFTAWTIYLVVANSKHDKVA